MNLEINFELLGFRSGDFIFSYGNDGGENGRTYACKLSVDDYFNAKNQ